MTTQRSRGRFANSRVSSFRFLAIHDLGESRSDLVTPSPREPSRHGVGEEVTKPHDCAAWVRRTHDKAQLRNWMRCST
jgi:hypothetical protein